MLNYKINNLLSAVVFTVIIVGILSFTSLKPKGKYKLLVYATIEDSLSLRKTDTNWVNSDVCIKIAIDTISTLFIDEFKDGKRFYYKGHIFFKDQVFELDKKESLSDLVVSSFTISCSGVAFEPPYIANKSKCLSEEQIYQIKEYYRFSWKFSERVFKIYFSEIKAKNPTSNNTINLNQIVCLMK